MRDLYNFLVDSFSGLSKEVWWLALVSLINRAGSMVIPFLSLYLTESEGYSLIQVGWIMSAFGAGSLVGTYLGGVLTDRIGNYKVMCFSLFSTGVLFILLQWADGFWMFCSAIFVIMLVADSFRPAIFVALNAYSKPENRTRSVTLIRLAINLGFAAGPAVGGWIIATMSYTGLFWVDGLTCIAAVILLLVVLNPKRAKSFAEPEPEKPLSPCGDSVYLIFFAALVLFALAFMQYFSTLPLYYKEVYGWTEDKIGLLLGLNGLLILILEMPVVKYLEGKAGSKMRYVIVGAIFLAFSFLVLNLAHWSGLLIIGMVFMTFGEILAFPFSNAFAMDRSQRGKKGAYMALFSLSFSLAAIFGHNVGMRVVDGFGFDAAWYLMTILIILSTFLLWIVRSKLIQEEQFPS